MTLNQPYYIDIRTGRDHLDLNGEWSFFYADEVMEYPEMAQWQYKTTLPKSIYHSLYEAGVLPDPYVGANSGQYRWVDEKIWYYRKKFMLDMPDFSGNAFLCFEGVAYYCRLWVNGRLLGDHEGMFGGPVVDIGGELNLCGENEIVVEVKSVNYGMKDEPLHIRRRPGAPQIVPWNLVRDDSTSNGDFIVIGLWGNIRLEFTEKLHISRPHIYTKNISGDQAELFLEFEVVDGSISELRSYDVYEADQLSSSNIFTGGITGICQDKEVEFRIQLREKSTGKVVYESLDSYKLLDMAKTGATDNHYLEIPFFAKSITIDHPHLWYPVGMGEPFLYELTIEMYDAGRCCDRHTITTGIRTFTASRTAGPRYRTFWNDFLFEINGREFFLKGMNWMPIDFLLSIDPAEYKWCLNLVKNAGIQMLRVWSGGGMPEADTFYQLCDSLGIMVWQDHMIANNNDTTGYDQEVLEGQEAYNIYRIRNHPSLVMHCGGNEFSAYHKGNAASMFVISRIIKALDPSRLYHYTTPDGGSAHVYNDMEPAWYRYRYAHLPFLAESGIHNFPTYHSLKGLLRKEETTGVLCDITSPEFRKQYPELLNHFTEYQPDRVPRMLSRISQIGNIQEFDLEQMCEAGQVQAYEYYTLMIQAMHGNYPYCGGILPWVFKRPWTTVGVQLIDGCGRATYPYYAVKNTYKPINISMDIAWSVIAPGETVPLKGRLFNDNGVDLDGSKVDVAVYAPDMSVARAYSCVIGNHKKSFAFEAFIPDETYRDQCFLICADLTKDGVLLSRTSYFIKCTSQLADQETYRKHRSEPSANLSFPKGPWLKTGIRSGRRAKLGAEMFDKGKADGYHYFHIYLRNDSDTAAYPVTVEVANTAARFYANDNFFLMKPHEIRQLHIVCDGLKDGENAKIIVGSWNAETINLSCLC